MTKHIYLHRKPRTISFTQLPNFLFELPGYHPLGNEAKILYADEYDRVYLYYPINEVTTLLYCGRQKAVDTLRELQYAGLLEIRKQGCGKPNRIYPKWHEAVPDAESRNPAMVRRRAEKPYP